MGVGVGVGVVEVGVGVVEGPTVVEVGVGVGDEVGTGMTGGVGEGSDAHRILRLSEHKLPDPSNHCVALDARPNVPVPAVVVKPVHV